MPSILIMAWNVENFGDTKWKKSNGRAELIALLSKVIRRIGVDIVGFSEMRSNRAQQIGQALVAHLDANTSVGQWASQHSPQFVKNRLEQYLFVWDTAAVTLYNAPNSFQHAFPDPVNAPKLLGFRRQANSDRPPYLGYFQTVAAPQISVPTAVFHAPEPSFFKDVRDACRKLAEVTELQTAAEAAVVMGDFNVKHNANQAVANSFGDLAFSDLVNAGFKQLVTGTNKNADDRLTSLIDYYKAFAGMNEDDCYSQPYDNIFLRKPNPNPSAVKGANPGLEELIQECVGANYLGPFLQALHARRDPANAPASYATIEDAFVPFCRYVSDHMPVVTEVSWT